MNQFNQIREYLKKAEAVILALHSDATAASNLHACKVHIWKALDELAEAEEAA